MGFITDTFNYLRPSLTAWFVTVLQVLAILIVGWFLINKLCTFV